MVRLSSKEEEGKVLGTVHDGKESAKCGASQ